MGVERETLVSVVMPAYNARDTIGDAIRSVLEQTYSELELIIVDDGSTDDTADVARSFQDKRVQVFQQDSNQGAGPARNLAIARASGGWITLIDADDFWDKKRLEMLLAPGNSPTDGYMIADNIEEFYDTPDGIKAWGTIWDKQVRFTDNVAEVTPGEYLSCKRWVMQPLIPRAAITGNALTYSSYPVAEDVELYLRLMKRAGLKLRLISFAGYHYRHTPGSISTHPERSEFLKNMLTGLQGELDFSDAETTAIEKKIALLDRHIHYLPFLQAVQEKDLAKVLGLALRNPAYIIEFIKRVPDTLRYRIHVLLHRGSSR